MLNIITTGKALIIQKMEDSVVRTSKEILQLQENKVCDIVWITGGDAELVATKKMYALHNSIYCFGPSQLKRIIKQDGIKGFHLAVPAGFLFVTGQLFNLSFLNNRYPHTKDPLIIPVSEWSHPFIADVLLKMEEEQRQSLPLRSEMMARLFNIFLMYLSRECSVKPLAVTASSHAMLVEQFFGLLPNGVQTKKKVQEYAQALHITPNYLNRVIKKMTGRTASHHIQQQIIDEAKKQAMSAGASMKEVAYGLGFESMAHFSKFFKANCGVNFTMFRKQAFCMVPQ